MIDWEDPEMQVALAQELARIIGNQFAGHAEPYRYFVMHPLLRRKDAVQFLRSVPSDTPLFDVPRLADAWVAENPTAATAEEV